MRLLITLSIQFLIVSITISQKDLIKTHQKLLSFKQAKFSPGLSLDYGSGSLYTFTGHYKKGEILNPFYASGIGLIDYYAPKSRISFAGGIEWNYFSYTFTSNSLPFVYDNVSIQYIKTPLLLKFSTGHKFSLINIIFFGGASYDIPLFFTKIDVNNDTTRNVKFITQNYTTIGGLAFQINFRGKARGDNYIPLVSKSGRVTYIKAVFPRIWIYIKLTQNLKNLFNTNYTKEIFNGVKTSDLFHRDTRYSIGLAFFIGSNKSHSIE